MPVSATLVKIKKMKPLSTRILMMLALEISMTTITTMRLKMLVLVTLERTTRKKRPPSKM